MYKIIVKRILNTFKISRVVRNIDINTTGKRGLPGEQGADGEPGVGVPAGGTTNQVLKKASNADYDTEWGAGGGGGGDVESVNGQTGVVVLDKDDIGLGNVDNTSDANKPVSTAQATAIGVVQSDINAHEANTSNPHSVTKTQVGLGNADNTSDANKPVSSATQTALDGKVDENAAITGATKTKITYDAKGLVTAGADATTADINDSADRRYVTDAQQDVIENTSGVNTGDQTNITGNAGTATELETARNIDGQAFDGSQDITVIAAGTHAAPSKTTPVDADELPLVDSAASNILKRLTWANLKATLKTYFDTLYQVAGSYLTASSVATLTNKTIDANGTGNSISNLEVADLASGVLDTDLTTVSASDDTLPSAKATKTYADSKVADAINNGVTTIAPSQNAVFDALALKEDLVNKDTDGTLAADSDTKYPSQRAVKTYVDSIAQGLDIKVSVRVATTANITLSGEQSIDGVAAVTGDRVLVKDQSTGANNGIYVVAAGAWSRSTDANTSAKVTQGMFTFVEEGTVNADNGWVLTTNGPIVLGTTALVFSQFSGAGQIVAGAALTKSGNTLDVAVDNTTIEVSSDALRIKDAGVTNAKVATGIDAAKIANGSVSDAEFQRLDGVSSGIQSQLDLKAPLASPTFTGTVVLPTTTMNGVNTLGENAELRLDPAGSADGKFSGITVVGLAGYTQAFGDLVYLDPTDSRWEAVDANAAGAADGDARGMIGIVVSAGTDGNACTILLQGIIRADAKFPAFTINNPVYASETAGSVTQTQPTTTDVVIRVVGFALTADEMYFNPSPDYITHT